MRGKDEALSGNNGHDVFFAHDEQFVAVDLDGGAGVLAEQDLVAHLDVDREQLAVFILLAGANCQHFALPAFSAERNSWKY